MTLAGAGWSRRFLEKKDILRDLVPKKDGMVGGYEGCKCLWGDECGANIWEIVYKGKGIVRDGGEGEKWTGEARVFCARRR